jgi:H/ACA ribonucleoprotein complex subunit 3
MTFLDKLLRKCPACNSYTLEKRCPKCGSETVSPHPAKFSPDDKYARYRVRDRYLEKSE